MGSAQPAELHRRKALSNALKCSFCGKREDEVAKLVAGTGGRRSHPSVFICDGCVQKATDIMTKADSTNPEGGNGSIDGDGAWDER